MNGHPLGPARVLVPRSWMSGMLAVVVLALAVLVPAVADAAPAAAAERPVAAAPRVSDAATSIRPMSLDGFSAGNIISNSVFTNSSTMTADQIQAFFNAKVPVCQTGYTCLKDFRTTSQDRPADAYCNGYSGVANETAASIIYRVAQSCHFNPQVLIVMLQKEQGLVTHTWPSSWRYDSALGQGCPDTAPCDPTFVGFFQQIYGAARQMQIYMEGRWFTWYAPGNTWNILYNPNQSCGSAPVYISNAATAALYYYTPYQPNAAALAAGYGEGDGCSAYGNRNFYNYFTDWFGSTQSTGARILKDAASGAMYLVADGQKYSFPTSERAAQYTWIASTETVSASLLASFPDAGPAPRAVRTDQGVVYLLDSGRRLHVPTCALAIDFGWSCGSLPTVAQGQANRYPDAGDLAPSVRAVGSTWFIQGGSRREILDTSLLPRYGISSAVSTVADALATEHPIGDPVLGAGIYDDASGNSDAVLGNGAVYSMSAQARVDAMRAATKRLTSDSLARLHPAGSLPLAVTVDGRSFVLSNDGWMAVDSYGSLVAFAALPSGALNGLPQTAPALGPHFVRERSSLQIFLVSYGTLQAVSAESQQWIGARYGVSTQVRVLADTLLGKAASAQQMVRTADGAAYLIDGTNRYRFLDCSQVTDWGGDCTKLPVVTSAQLSQATDRGWLTPLIRQSSGTIWLVQSATRREVVDPAVLAPYGIGSGTTTLSGSLFDAFTVGQPVLSSGAYSDGGSGLVFVNPAGAFSLPAANRLPVVTSGTRALTAASFALLVPQAALPSRLLSDGRAFILTSQGWLQVDPVQYGGQQAFASLGSKAWNGVALAGTETRPHFVRESSTATRFLVSWGTVTPVSSDAQYSWITSRYGVPGTVWTVADGTLNGLGLQPGSVVKDSASRALLADGMTYYTFSGCDIVAAFGADCSSAPLVTPANLGMTDGGALAPLLRGAAGDLWLVQSGKRREVPDPSLLAPYGIGSSSTAVSSALLSGIAVGDPVVGVGPYRTASGAMRVVLGSGGTVDVPTAAQVDVLTSSAKLLTDASFARLTSTGTLPVRAVSGASAYVLSSQGWLTVDRTNYGTLAFPATTADVIAAVPQAGVAAMGPRFVREAASSQVYLASGGLTPMSAQDQAWATATYGVPSTVLVVANGALH